MAKFQVGVSGWLTVEVEADTAEQAEAKVEEERPGASGELYDMEVQDTVELCPVCETPQDSDGRCRCTNKDAQ